MEPTRSQPVSSPGHCPLCRESFGGEQAVGQCPDCGTAFHRACADELRVACPTLGCARHTAARSAPPAVRPAPRPAPPPPPPVRSGWPCPHCRERTFPWRRRLVVSSLHGRPCEACHQPVRRPLWSDAGHALPLLLAGLALWLQPTGPVFVLLGILALGVCMGVVLALALWAPLVPGEGLSTDFPAD